MYMDAMTFNNGPFNGSNKTFTKKQPRIKTSTFSQVVLKSDVGEFQDGIFVAAEPVKETHSTNRNKNYHKTTERPTLERPKSEPTLHGRPTHQHREHSHPNIHQHNNYDNNVQYVPPSGDSNVSSARLSPARSPNRRHSPNSQSGYADHSANPHTLSPPKHRKPPQEKLAERPEGSDRGGSPPKDKSPAPSRWAGPAFSNAPPPSSLPIPDFPPFTPSPPSSATSSASSSPSSSPPPAPVPTQLPFPVLPHPAYVYSHPAYYQLPQHPAYFSSYAYAQSAQSVEDQLSMDLRRMLHIEQPITPIFA